MQEIIGELWTYFQRPDTIVLITTNGTLRKDGAAVMGRGCASEARVRFPGIDAELGKKIATLGNRIHPLEHGLIYSFPVKHQWHEEADLKLIGESARQLEEIASSANANTVFVLPRPGCGNGRLVWPLVKPVIDFLPDSVWVITNGK